MSKIYHIISSNRKTRFGHINSERSVCRIVTGNNIETTGDEAIEEDEATANAIDGELPPPPETTENEDANCPICKIDVIDSVLVQSDIKENF